MDATPSSALSPNLRTGGLGSRATISLTALVALGFFISVALPYLLLDPTVLPPFGARRGWRLAHVAAGGVALLTGPVQLWLGISHRSMHLHRRLGLAYVMAV